MLQEAERIARGPAAPPPPPLPVPRAAAVVLPKVPPVRPGGLEVSRGVRETITTAILRLGLESSPPRLLELRRGLTKNIWQEQIDVVHAELWADRSKVK